MHKLKYLPLALDDLRDITDYITGTLKAQKAAGDLLDAIEESVSRLEQFPYSCKVYHPIKKLENEYRLLPVKNYIVNEQYVEIHRVVYAKMDLTRIVKDTYDENRP